MSIVERSVNLQNTVSAPPPKDARDHSAWVSYQQGVAFPSPNAKVIGKKLVSWFHENGRSFPWRLERDPYAILIAEKLLQQTAARRVVVDAYCELLHRYPTANDLARADVRTLKRIFRPLGLCYRAKELRVIGRTLTSQFGGTVPSELKSLMLLPGVGDYAARAVLSFAFGRDVPVVDTNVARFLYRCFGISAPFPANPARKKHLIDLASNLLPKGQSREFNFAILDLCAEVCTPKRPRCEFCPVQKFCAFVVIGYNTDPGK